MPFPLQTADEVLQAVLGCVGPRTRLALLDHVTSQTALVLPIERLVAALAERGVDTLVDGAHAPGMLPLDLDRLGAAWYTGNCHKWLCAPKGSAFLHIRKDRQNTTRPLAISHGASTPRTDRPRHLIEFDWTGTDDPTAILAITAAIDFLQALLPGGIEAVRAHNRNLCLKGREKLAVALGVDLPCPAEQIGSIASLPLPNGLGEPSNSPLYQDPLQDELLYRFGIEVPVVPWPAPPRRLLRISAQAYNTLEQYDYLAGALTALFKTP